MLKTEALEILNLKVESPEKSEVIRAFSRLSLRYPQQSFAARHRALLDARDFLLRQDQVFRSLLFDSTLDLEWLKEFSKGQQAEGAAPSFQTLLGNMMKPLFLEGESAFGEGKLDLSFLEGIDISEMERLVGEMLGPE